MTHDTNDLMDKLNKLNWLLHRQQRRVHTRHGPMGDPHRGQGRVLTMLMMQPEISQRDLSYLLDMRPQSLGELLLKLERGGYIERTPSETDKRVMNIRLTESGKAEAAQKPDSWLDGVLACLNQEEQERFGAYLDRLIAALEEHLGEAAEALEAEMASPVHPHRCRQHGPRHEHGPHQEWEEEGERHPRHGCGRPDHGGHGRMFGGRPGGDFEEAGRKNGSHGCGCGRGRGHGHRHDHSPEE